MVRTIDLTDLQREVLLRVLKDIANEHFLVDTVVIQEEFGMDGIVALHELIGKIEN